MKLRWEEIAMFPAPRSFSWEGFPQSLILYLGLGAGWDQFGAWKPHCFLLSFPSSFSSSEYRTQWWKVTPWSSVSLRTESTRVRVIPTCCNYGSFGGISRRAVPTHPVKARAMPFSVWGLARGATPSPQNSTPSVGIMDNESSIACNTRTVTSNSEFLTVTDLSDGYFKNLPASHLFGLKPSSISCRYLERLRTDVNVEQKKLASW